MHRIGVMIDLPLALWSSPSPASHPGPTMKCALFIYPFISFYYIANKAGTDQHNEAANSVGL